MTGATVGHRESQAGSRRLCVRAALVCLQLALFGCNAEKRELDPSTPAAAPTSRLDARSELYEKNAFEQSEGGRLFRWSGCGACHTDGAPGFANLADDTWRYGGSTPEIYLSIQTGRPGMPAYGSRLGSQALWQIAGYLHVLHTIKPPMRRRQDNALQGEPSAASWTGPLR